VAAGYSDRVVFLADGLVVGELAQPNSQQILDQMARLRG
jgi:putative ABC transport system ATP-binding protein